MQWDFSIISKKNEGRIVRVRYSSDGSNGIVPPETVEEEYVVPFTSDPSWFKQKVELRINELVTRDDIFDAIPEPGEIKDVTMIPLPPIKELPVAKVL